MYMGASRATLACNPVCQPTIMLGDDVGFSSSTLASSNLLEDAAR
jgi:hypothetical protein